MSQQEYKITEQIYPELDRIRKEFDVKIGEIEGEFYISETTDNRIDKTTFLQNDPSEWNEKEMSDLRVGLNEAFAPLFSCCHNRIIEFVFLQLSCYR